MSFLDISNLSQTYGDKEVLKNVNLGISKGEFIALVGMSGGGKSTLLRLIAGLEKPTGGSITFNGQQLSGLNQQARVMFQDDRLLPWKTVLGNLLLTTDDLDKAKRLLARVGLEDYADAYPATLSGGQRQRAALARALISSPKLLLLDEPLGALDALTRSKMQELILQVCKEEGITTVLVTHDVREATIMANKIWVIKNHGIAAEMVNDFRDQYDDQAQLAKDKIVHDTLEIILGEDDAAA
ncbi:aliphatic sulfonates import ATP-binding protein SsuB [Lactobacillus nasalidis]|uniref:Aliphatic sulfonates import ATP-binding protein SsuB n=1 Tax=Lactobacillus nasalidis TaxID=2797258 RepID=A0ABQ3W2D7_9LACO|nr:ABC transporter ATP-binding protein [Lactobacillus nasalidis]GHV96956.1 aliphatic sulfonates import ATP-binding protein SsuB [Lactobacillus nasalidis]GHV99892.1 aliphatic sulfonates import ATP-binding protein SsuB [Lactobacillus nasalidis]GHW00425.1 aliphatic sulfonates import ATP-binding protein SsuB [Lactobacillus nasalidis]